MSIMISSNAKKNLIGLLVVVVILAIFFLSGPAKALIVFLTPATPSNVTRGTDVAFNVLVVITPPDSYVPIRYTDIVFTGPGGFHKGCRVNINGTDDCPDVDIMNIPVPMCPTPHFGLGHRFAMDWNYTGGTYGYWYPIGGYNFGYGYGFGYGPGPGYGYGYGPGYGYGYGPFVHLQCLAYHVVWHTEPTLTSGSYHAQGRTFVNGGPGPGPGPGGHYFSSQLIPFIISGGSQGRRLVGGGGGGGGGSTCGNGICDAGENYTNCPQDCTAPGSGNQTNQTNQTNPTTPSGGVQPGAGGLLGGKSLWIIIAIVIVALISFFIIRVKKKK